MGQNLNLDFHQLCCYYFSVLEVLRFDREVVCSVMAGYFVNQCCLIFYFQFRKNKNTKTGEA
jgi:hypothetical protein